MSKRYIFAGGGSAGHVEPALAVATALSSLEPDAECIFLGTATGLETTLVPNRGFKLALIPKVPAPRKFSLSTLTFPFRYLASVRAVQRELRGATALIGFGGYVSASAYLAARLSNVPIVIHEANARPGLANRFGRKFAARTAVNFASVKQQWPESIVTGMPIRESILKFAKLNQVERAALRAQAAAKWGFDPARPIIAVFGGSLGARRINLAIEELVAGELGQLQIIHALGSANELPTAQAGYLPQPYFADMAMIYGACDLVIARSGAVTCAELEAVARYAILVPLPHGNGEQSANAAQLEAAGLAFVVRDNEFNGAWLHANLETALTKASNLVVREFSDPAAATKLARLLIEVSAVKR